MAKNIKKIDGAKVIDKALEGFLTLFAVWCLIAGIVSGMWHCFLIAGMSFALVWACKEEDRKNG